MGKDLHPSIIDFFIERMSGHNNVADFRDESDEENYLFRIVRARQRDTVLVWLSDAYEFTDADYYARPTALGPGDFILVAKPEGGFHLDQESIDHARIGVGQIGKFMGALNSREMWTYLTRDERERLERERGRR
jgi:hypothetical protein